MNNATRDFKNFIRAKYAFPGGYSLHMLCADGGAICHRCASDNARLIIKATRNHDIQWEFIGADINWEDNALYCDNCNNTIEPQYS